MKRQASYTILFAMFFFGTTAAYGGPHQSKKADIVDTEVNAGSFNTLVAAVKAAGLVETLKGQGPFTVFAPMDEAFAKLPGGTLESLLMPENKDKLTAILTYHVVAGKVTADQVVNIDAAKTVNGKLVNVRLDDGTVFIDQSRVVQTDIRLHRTAKSSQYR